MAGLNKDRRTFLRQTSAALMGGWLALRAGWARALAGTGRPADGTVPALTGLTVPALTGLTVPVILEKKLDPKWVRSLYERGAPTVYTKAKNELTYIGMPVGGIACGTVYLGGDGRLWLWDIFNKNQDGIEPKVIKWSPDGKDPVDVRSSDGACYVEPSKDIRPLQQGCSIAFVEGDEVITRELRADLWADVTFEATYPVAVVRYSDPEMPVEVRLEAFSPFIPLETEDSGLPATVLSFSVRNVSNRTLHVSLEGWLENKTGIYSAKTGVHQRVNTAIREDGFCAIQGTVNGPQIESQSDFGTMCIAALGKTVSPRTAGTETRDAAEPLIANVAGSRTIAPGAEANFNLVITWHFPNLFIADVNNPAEKGRWYANRFPDALSVARYIHQHFERLSSATRLWKKTWYDSTLPHWFLDRTFLNISTLSTTTCHRFSSGRYWTWEGVGSCPGNCTHVWHYAQAVGRIFPALERDTRERVDLRISLEPDGGIWFRAEAEKRPAIDGQAGTILRCYREHCMSSDGSFLRGNWDRIKRAVGFLLAQDHDGDGLEDVPLENTLDAVWKGEIAWIAGLSIAGVRAGEQMALEAGDEAFAARCRDYVDKGNRSMVEKLFNGEYFIHLPDPETGRKTLGSYDTSHIDQVLGQAWAFQAGLGRLWDREMTRSALRSLWKYNFTTDVGPYRVAHRGGRPYALAGEGGMIMNTNPYGEDHPYGEDVTWQAGYFNECMTGFEHQVAAHMMAEGMTDESLVMTRTIHDRYHAFKRNPFNEIECSDHYGRAMASFGTFLSACGYAYHGPDRWIRFAPVMSPDDFRAPFTGSEGWGTYQQKRDAKGFHAGLTLRYGRLALREVRVVPGRQVGKAQVLAGSQPMPCRLTRGGGGEVSIRMEKDIVLDTDTTLTVDIAYSDD